ncbi:hypothetical protein, conserved [Plasmodium vivax]|uniref:VIR protein n=1 Tax=Plasmodium vivax TaxID=5855 RepID=A0A1G4EJJ2_PLAVI|nr:hypothetical protein, conserved [Plasmodium vivax]
MSPCRTGSDTYLKHACYTYLKDKFKNTNMGEYSKEYFNKIYDIFKTKNTRHSVYHSLLHEIIKYTSIDAVFADADPRIACKFINYLLNDKLRKSYYHNDSIPPYEIYKNFVKDFYEKRHGGYHKNKACDIYIEDITQDIFERMTILYQLYDEYDGLKNTKEKVDPTDCIELSKFAKNFNYTASNHGTKDSDLLKRLTELRDLIEKRISSPNYNCVTNITFFHLPKTSSTVQEKQVQDLSQGKGQKESALKSPEILPITSSTDQEKKGEALYQGKEQHDPALKLPGLLPKTQGKVQLLPEISQVPKEPEVPVVVTTSRGPETVTAQMESHHQAESASLEPLGYTQETGNYESGTPHRLGTSYRSASSYKTGSFRELGHSNVQRSDESYLVTEEEKGNTEGGIYPPGYQISNAAAKEGRVSGILSSITGVLGDVDPVPIVGVSGGMGALFLLFRLEPSLEEADVDNESLLDSMEYIQDFSQVFKDMKMDLLDTINLI